MPWQQLVADVVLEIDPETGRLTYDEYGLTVPRQSGKSTFVEGKAFHRCSATGFFGPRQRVIYTAQTRLKAREKWEDDFLADLNASPAFRGRYRAYLANGNEHMRWRNGSRFGLEAVTEKAGHGITLDEAFLDEAFAHQDHRLEQAFGPAMITRANKQLGWISTAGWLDASPYLQDKVELGRLAAESGRRTGLAYFEWSAPEDADPGDPAVWRACMPALGHTISEAAIRAEYDKARDAGRLNEFRRAYLNQWVSKDVPEVWSGPVSEDHWDDLADSASEPQYPVALAVVYSADRSRASVGLAGRRTDGLLHGELADYRLGTSWVAARVTELCERHDPCAVVIDPGGHEGSVIPELDDAGIKVVRPSGREVAAAYGVFIDSVNAKALRHRGQPELTAAVAAAVPRPVGDTGTAWGRRRSGGDISPVVAVTAAVWGFSVHGPGDDPGEPGIWVI